MALPRRPSDFLQERVVLTCDHVAVSATTTIKMHKVTRAFRVTAVRYVNPAGLALDPSNYFVGTLQNAGVVMATVLNTNTAGGVALAANTFASGVLSATPANQAMAADDEMSLVLTKTGTQTLPIGKLIVEGVYL